MTTDRKKLVKKMDALCRQILLVRDRRQGDYFRCISCRRLLPLNVANVSHYISRRYESLRWDFRNIHLACVHCNKFLTGNLIEYRKSLIEKYGEAEIVKMESLYRVSPNYSTFDLMQLIKEYQEILACLKQAKAATGG